MTIKGKVHKVGKVTQVSDKFKKQELVLLDDSSQYPQHIVMEAQQDNIKVLEGLKIGETVECHLNLRGREWINPQGEAKYFNTLVVWKIDKLTESAQNKDKAHYVAGQDDLPWE